MANLTEHEIHMINFLPDFWDMIEAFHLAESSGEGGRERRSAPPRPTCSAIIKHLPEEEDIYFAHNAWHEYRAMTYRCMKYAYTVASEHTVTTYGCPP